MELVDRRLTTAVGEIQLAIQEYKRERDDARAREAELEVALDAERGAASSREATLVSANERLMARVDELSQTATKLQAQVIELTRSQNDQLRAMVPATPDASRGGQRAPRSAAPPAPDADARAACPSGAPSRGTSPEAVSRASASFVGGPGVGASPLLAELDRSVDAMRAGTAADLAAYRARLATKLRGEPGGSLLTPSPTGEEVPRTLQYAPSAGSAATPAAPPPAGGSYAHPRTGSASSSAVASGVSHSPPAPDTRTGAVLMRVSPVSEMNRPVSRSRRGSASKPTAFSSGAAVVPAGSSRSTSSAKGSVAKPVAGAGGRYTRTGSADSSVGPGPATKEGGSGGAVASLAGQESGGVAGAEVRPEVRAAPYDGSEAEARPARAASTAQAASTGPRAPAPAAAAPLTAPAFFALLRTHVHPSNLETLMAALSVFNKGSIGKGELLTIAERALRGGGSGGEAVDGPDLISMFKTLILRG
jgi:hypothetical protein